VDAGQPHPWRVPRLRPLRCGQLRFHRPADGRPVQLQGRARQLEVKVTRPGFEQAATLARDLSGV